MAFSFPGERNGGSLHSCLGNPTDRGALWATAHGVAELDTPVGLSRHRERFYYSGELTYTTQYSGGSRYRKEPSLRCCYSVLFGSRWKAETGPGERRGRFPLSVANSHGSVKIRENTQPTDFRMTTVMQFIISFSE